MMNKNTDMAQPESSARSTSPEPAGHRARTLAADGYSPVLHGALSAPAVGVGAGLGAASATATASPAQAAAPVTFAPGRPVLFRRATVVTMDPRRGVLPDTDVLVRGTDLLAAVGREGLS